MTLTVFLVPKNWRQFLERYVMGHNSLFSSKFHSTVNYEVNLKSTSLISQTTGCSAVEC